MCSYENKLDEFLNKFSNPLKVFRENKVRKEIENHEKESKKMKDHLVEEARQLFERNKTNFKSVEDFSEFKYS